LTRLRRQATATLVVAGVLAGGWLWLRDSSLVEVRVVTVRGAVGRDGQAIARALRAAASDMTTLHVRPAQLRDAVRAYPIVRDLRVNADPPHRLVIRVVYYRAVAVALIAGRGVPVASDGTLLSGGAATADLPAVPARGAPGTRRLSDPSARSAVALLGAAPPVLLPLVQDVRRDGDGLHLGLRSGPRVDFGAPVGLEAKWAAAARLLADGRAAGASYLDVSAPERPVAGLFADGAPAADGAPTPAPAP
jgi:cell division protein FtsQ